MDQLYGVRPIVCLKSDVKLEKQGDGSYKILEEESILGSINGVAGVKTETVLTVDNFANGKELPYTDKQQVLNTITEKVGSTEPSETSLELMKTGDN